MDNRHYILTLHEAVTQDPVLIEACKTLFEFANKMGLEGHKMTNLQFIKGNDPLDPQNYVVCEVEMKDDEGPS